MRKWGICCLLIVIGFQLRAQQYSLRQYMVLDGLPQSQVNMMLEDGNGYLWIATHGGGLARYDGRQFKVYTTRDGLLNNIIHYLKLDSKQNLWIVHPRGLTRFNGHDFKKFQQPGSSTRRIRRVFEFQDSIYLLNSQGMLGKIAEDSVYYWSKPVKENRIILYSQLLPTKDFCLYLNDSSFLVKKEKEEFIISHKKEFGRLLSMFNRDKDVFLETDRGYFVLDYLHRKLVKKDLAVFNHVLFYDVNTKSYWTRTGDNLLKEYFREGSHLIDTVLRETAITQIFPDSEGNTWLGSSGKGLFKYFIQDFDRCASKKLDAVMAIERDEDDAFWVGTMYKGLWKMRNGKATQYNLSLLNDNSISAIRVSPKGDLWVGMFGGLGKYNREHDNFKWMTRTDGLPSSYINQIDFDARGNVWYATNGGGAGFYDEKNFTNFSVDQGLNGKNMAAIRYSPYHQTIFLGGDNGLNAIKNGKVSSVDLPEFENTSIQSINLYKEKWILLGSGGAGVIIYNPENGSKNFIDTRNGLPSDFIYFVAADVEDLIWVGTEKGISKIKLSNNLEVEENLHFGYENGLAGLQANLNAFHLGKEKIFGLIDGMYQYNDLRKEGWHSFDVHLTDVEIFNGQFDSHYYADSLEGFFKIPVYLNLPSDKNHITFRFNRVDKRYPKAVQYKYTLENFDKTWSLASATGQVTYSNLPPGNYTFKVMGTDNKGSWSKEPLIYSFIVLTPFYQTAAFRIAVGLVLVGAIGLALYVRMRRNINKVMEVQRIRQQEQDSLRKEIARDFHDEMGNQLTRIINYISLMKLNNANSHANGNGYELYNKVEESAKYLYTGTRDFIWSIDPINDELSKLFIHIRDFGEKLFNEKEINFRAFDEVKAKIHVPYGFSREANLIFKEAMTNSFNHSKAKNVSFTLREEGDKFLMELKDDGCGFTPEEIKKVNGVKNMKSRAQRINASIDVVSNPGKGTTISLIFSTTKSKQHDVTV
jgi:ligand-binding sensor domain-containing protein/signal transduction histidine kinase